MNISYKYVDRKQLEKKNDNNKGKMNKQECKFSTLGTCYFQSEGKIEMVEKKKK